MRIKAAEGEKFTANCREWLKLDKQNNVFIVNESIAETIKAIFQMSIDGMGVKRIADYLNINISSYPPLRKNKGWVHSYVQKILKSRSVCGELQLHKYVDGKRVAVGEPILNYYPQIIDTDVFNLARIRAATRKKSGGRKGKDGSISNIFSRVIRCKHCNGTVILRRSGATKANINGGKYLICETTYSKKGAILVNIGVMMILQTASLIS